MPTGRYGSAGHARSGSQDIHADAEQSPREVAQDRQDRGRAGYCAGRSQVPVSAFLVGASGVMESDLERAQRKLLEWCAEAAYTRMANVNLDKLRNLLFELEIAKVNEASRKIA